MYLLEQYVVLTVGKKEKMCRVIKQNGTKKIITTKKNHQDMLRSGTKNNCAIRREGACSRPAKRQRQGKGATEKGRTEGFEQADGGGPQSKAVGRKR